MTRLTDNNPFAQGDIKQIRGIFELFARTPPQHCSELNDSRLDCL
jgi:hypothetical protein